MPKEFKNEDEYKQYPSLQEIFGLSQNAVKTDKDKLFVDFDEESLIKKIKTYFAKELDDEFVEEYDLNPTSSYDPINAKKGVKFSSDDVRKCLYRPFDSRWMYYNKEVTSRPAWKVMEHMVHDGNMCLITTRQVTGNYFNHVLATDSIVEIKAGSHDRCCEVFPLYRLPSKLELVGKDLSFKPNLTENLISTFEKNISSMSQDSGDKSISYEEFFFYTLGVLNSKSYQERYFSNLKIDYPRIPIIKDLGFIRKISVIGRQLFETQNLSQISISKEIRFPIKGDMQVSKPHYVEKSSRIYINDTQYFSGVSAEAWAYDSCGYPVLMKWLKDRKGRVLSYDETNVFSKIIQAVHQTLVLKLELEKIIKDAGNWKALAKNALSLEEEVENTAIENTLVALQKVHQKKKSKKYVG